MTLPNSDAAILTQAFTLGAGVVVRNRLVKSAMSETLADRHGRVTPELIRLYSAWAAGGIGLCITGNVMVDRHALGEPGNVVIEDDSQIELLTSWARAATAGATQCWVQLNHPGRQAVKGLNRENVAPSAIPFRKDMQLLFPTPREMTADEITRVIGRFARAAGIVKRAGFTGVQIHGAHGYLVSQFLSPLANVRTDEWGGTPENRRRFVLEILRAIRNEVGADFPVGIKLNSADFQRGGFTEDESLATIRALADEGVDLIEISGGTYETPAMTGIQAKPSTLAREAYFLEFAAKVRAEIPTPLIVTGGFRSSKGMAGAIRSGQVDFVGLARALAIETDLPRRVLQGGEPNHIVRPIRTRIAAIDKTGLMEIAFYTAQLKRIGRGVPPKPNEQPLWLFVKSNFALFRHGLANRPRRLRART